MRKEDIITEEEFCKQNAEVYVNWNDEDGTETVFRGTEEECLKFQTDLDKKGSYEGRKFESSNIDSITANTYYNSMSVDDLKEWVS